METCKGPGQKSAALLVRRGAEHPLQPRGGVGEQIPPLQMGPSMLVMEMFACEEGTSHAPGLHGSC